VSVYRKSNSPFYHFDFWCSGHRFHGSTGCTTRKEAEKFEAVERDKAKTLVKAAKLAAGSLLIDHVAERFWQAKGQHDAGADATSKNVARLVEYFGKTKSLTEIDDAAVTKMVAWRRGHRIKSRDAPLISPATVNRSATKILQRLFTFAKSEGARFEREPNWAQHWLKEPEERVRELQDDEADRLDDAMRADYAPFFDFVRATGLRQAECVTLRWSEVNFGTRQITRLGKGGRRVVVNITESIREIIFPLQGQHPEFLCRRLRQQASRHRARPELSADAIRR
jgi:integrase